MWGEDFRGRGCYLQPPGDPQRVNLTGILKQNNKAQAVIRSIASNTDKQRLTIGHVLIHGFPMTITKSLGPYEICGFIPYVTPIEKRTVEKPNARIYA
jgi:hypothetical protein